MTTKKTVRHRNLKKTINVLRILKESNKPKVSNKRETGK